MLEIVLVRGVINDCGQSIAQQRLIIALGSFICFNFSMVLSLHHLAELLPSLPLEIASILAQANLSFILLYQSLFCIESYLLENCEFYFCHLLVLILGKFPVVLGVD